MFSLFNSLWKKRNPTSSRDDCDVINISSKQDVSDVNKDASDDFVKSMEVPRHVLASYCSDSVLKSENLQERLLGCVGLLMYDCTNVLAQQNTILKEVVAEFTGMREDLKERKAAPQSGSILKVKKAEQKNPFSDKNKFKFSQNSKSKSQPTKRKLSTQNSGESAEVVYKHVKTEKNPESPSKSNVNSYAFFKEHGTPSPSKSSYIPPQDKKPSVLENVKVSLKVGANNGEATGEDRSMKKTDVGQTYVCGICSKQYKQLNGGIIKHLIEFHNVKQESAALGKHISQVYEIKDD